MNVWHICAISNYVIARFCTSCCLTALGSHPVRWDHWASCAVKQPPKLIERERTENQRVFIIEQLSGVKWICLRSKFQVSGVKCIFRQRSKCQCSCYQNKTYARRVRVKLFGCHHHIQWPVNPQMKMAQNQVRKLRVFQRWNWFKQHLMSKHIAWSGNFLKEQFNLTFIYKYTIGQSSLAIFSFNAASTVTVLM